MCQLFTIFTQSTVDIFPVKIFGLADIADILNIDGLEEEKRNSSAFLY